MCDTGSMVRSETSPKPTGRIMSMDPVARSAKPGLQVPRMPSVFHWPVCSRLRPGARHTTSTWSLAGASSLRRAVASTASA